MNTALAPVETIAEQAYATHSQDPMHTENAIKAAFYADLVGDDETALAIYEKLAERAEAPVSALINLAVLYEDLGELAKSEHTLKRILTSNPNHGRARLLIKDVQASREMIIEEHVQCADPSMIMMQTPITDFELSMRTRNALKKMNVRTLGDLLKISEAEIRSFRNFGDASLDEIKRMLAQKGFKLGQATDQHTEELRDLVLASTEYPPELLARPIQDLQLSIRARRAVMNLGCKTFGDLCLKTEAELMGIKNFGRTSLVEIKERLEVNGLALRNLEI